MRDDAPKALHASLPALAKAAHDTKYAPLYTFANDPQIPPKLAGLLRDGEHKLPGMVTASRGKSGSGLKQVRLELIRTIQDMDLGPARSAVLLDRIQIEFPVPIVIADLEVPSIVGTCTGQNSRLLQQEGLETISTGQNMYLGPP